MSIINITITGPAGSGKTTIAHRIRNSLADMAFMVGGAASQPVKAIIVDEGMTEQTFQRIAGDAPRVVVIREEDERRPSSRELRKVEAQRDELLAALEGVCAKLDGWPMPGMRAQYDAARAAIEAAGVTVK